MTQSSADRTNSPSANVSSPRVDWSRIGTGAAWGAAGTLLMSIPMIIAMKTGIAPMPEPIPLAIAKTILGGGAKPVLMAVAVISHFGYGAFWAGLATTVRWPFGLKDGLSLGVGLWLLMQVAVLPVIGWGIFGLEITGFPPKIAVGTLILHLIYGLVVGLGLAKSSG